MVHTPSSPIFYLKTEFLIVRQILLAEKIKKNRGPALTGVATQIGVRLLCSDLTALNAWIRQPPRPPLPALKRSDALSKRASAPMAALVPTPIPFR